MPLSRQSVREELRDGLRFIIAQSHVLRHCPDLVWQLAANEPTAFGIGYKAAELILSGNAPKPTWLERVSFPATQANHTGPESLAPVRTLAGHGKEITGVAVSPDGRFIASVSADEYSQAKLWDAETGEERQSYFHPLAGPVRGVAFTPDGNRLVIVSEDQRFLAWDVDSGKALIRQSTSGCPVRAVAVTSDGRHIIAGDDGGMFSYGIAAYDAAHGNLVRSFGAHEDTVTALAICGNFLVSGSRDGTLKVWSLATGSEIHTLQSHTGPVSSVVAMPDGWKAASAGYDGSIRVWEIASGIEVRVLAGECGPIAALAISRDGRSLVSGAEDGTVTVWDLESGVPVRCFTAHAGAVTALALKSGGRRLLSGGRDGQVREWNLADTASCEDAPVAAFRAGNCVLALALAGDGQRLAVLVTGKLRCWELSTGREICRAEPDTLSLTLVWVPGGREIVTVAQQLEPCAELWDVASGLRLATLKWPEDADRLGLSRVLLGSAMYPDGERYVRCGGFSRVIVSDLRAGTELGAAEGKPKQSFSTAAVSRDGRRIAAVGADHEFSAWHSVVSVAIWDADSLKLLRLIRDGRGRATGVVWMADGRHLLVLSVDETTATDRYLLSVWDAARGDRIARWMFESEPSGLVTTGGRIVVGDKLGFVHMFELRGVRIEPTAVGAGYISARYWYRCPYCFRDGDAPIEALGQVTACQTCEGQFTLARISALSPPAGLQSTQRAAIPTAPVATTEADAATVVTLEQALARLREVIAEQDQKTGQQSDVTQARPRRWRFWRE